MSTAQNDDFELLKEDIVKDFFEHDIIKINTKEFFTLSSGIKLPLYLDHRLIFSFPKLRHKVITAWSNFIAQKLSHLALEGNANIVFSGTATAGIAPAYALSAESQTGFIYVRNKSKEYGLQSQVEGSCGPNSKFIVIDDMVVSGSSILKNAQVLQELYGNESILCVTSISCHESAKMRHTFSENNVAYFSMFTTYEIFKIAHKIHLIDESTYEFMIQFLKTFDKTP